MLNYDVVMCGVGIYLDIYTRWTYTTECVNILLCSGILLF